MTFMTKSKTSTAQATYTASDKPGGYLPSIELDRANAFALMRIALEAVLTGDRNAVPEAVRDCVATYSPEFDGHRVRLLQAVDRVAAGGQSRDLEALVAGTARFFAEAESATATTAPKLPNESEIHATELNRVNAANADKHRVRYSNY